MNSIIGLNSVGSYTLKKYTATFANVTSGTTAATPSTFVDGDGTTVTEIDCRKAKAPITIQPLRLQTSHTADNWNINILGSVTSGGTTSNYRSWDGNADADPDIMMLTLGPNFISPTAEEVGGNRADFTLHFIVRE